MSISCCDPRKEPRAVDPNKFTLGTRTWTDISISVPSLLVPSGVPNGKLYAYPTSIPGGTPAGDDRYSPVSGIAPLLPTAGEWSIYSDSTTAIDVVVLDARDASTVATYQKPGFVVSTHTAPVVAAGPSSTTALAANSSRKYALFVNDSSNVMYLNLGGTSAPNTGIRINADGGSYEMMPGNMFYGIVTFIGTAADVLVVTEGT